MKSTFVPLLLGCWIAAAGGADLVVNGDFESGGGGDVDGWELLVVGRGSELVKSAGSGLGGGDAMFGSVGWVSGTGTKTEIRQVTGAGSVIPGEAYVLSFYAKGSMGPGGVAWYELQWIGAGGGVVGGSGLGNLFATLTGDYQEYGGEFTAPAGAVAVLVAIRLEGGAFAGSSGELWIDKVALLGASVVDPEPDGELNLKISRAGGALIFTWNSRAGKVYDLLSSETLGGDPLTWGAAASDIVATPRTNVETVALVGVRDEFFVLVEREP